MRWIWAAMPPRDRGWKGPKSFDELNDSKGEWRCGREVVMPNVVLSALLVGGISCGCRADSDGSAKWVSDSADGEEGNEGREDVEAMELSCEVVTTRSVIAVLSIFGVMVIST
mmetsp:Transcript_20022/g.41979  ORF Transcript_20022/g.41979 Transcript_20022/m.41979 type:complete len:113 (-) Transcript_20022:101-439(-)